MNSYFSSLIKQLGLRIRVQDEIPTMSDHPETTLYPGKSDARDTDQEGNLIENEFQPINEVVEKSISDDENSPGLQPLDVETKMKQYVKAPKDRDFAIERDFPIEEKKIENTTPDRLRSEPASDTEYKTPPLKKPIPETIILDDSHHESTLEQKNIQLKGHLKGPPFMEHENHQSKAAILNNIRIQNNSIGPLQEKEKGGETKVRSSENLIIDSQKTKKDVTKAQENENFSLSKEHVENLSTSIKPERAQPIKRTIALDHLKRIQDWVAGEPEKGDEKIIKTEKISDAKALESFKSRRGVVNSQSALQTLKYGEGQVPVLIESAMQEDSRAARDLQVREDTRSILKPDKQEGIASITESGSPKTRLPAQEIGIQEFKLSIGSINLTVEKAASQQPPKLSSPTAKASRAREGSFLKWQRHYLRV